LEKTTKNDESVRNRRVGWLLSVIGALLTVGMGFITLRLAPSMLGHDEGFTGTAKQATTFLTLFALVILFGLNSLIWGVRMIRTGQRSNWMLAIMVVLVLLIFVVASRVIDSV
jgi:hypothetical protein